MTRQDVFDAVIDVLQEVQALCGRQSIQLTAGSCPIGELDGFDSLIGIEATSLLSERLSVEIEPTLFVSADGQRPLTIDEIVSQLHSRIQQEREEQHV